MGSMESMHFLSEFAPKRRALNHAVSFVPHYHVFSMSSTKDYNDLCTDVHAEYCAEDPDGPGPITGAMVLAEDWPLKGASVENQFGVACSEKLMHRLSIDKTLVAKCVAESQERKLRAERGNTAWSDNALRINGWRYSGTLDAELVTGAICAGFDKKPDICQHIVTPANVFREVKTGGISVGVFFTVMLIIGFVMLAAMFFYKRSLTKHMHTTLREEVMLEVRSQMDAYRQLPA